MNKRNLAISIILNFLIVIMTIAATIMMFTGFRFMHGYEIILETTKLGMLKFYTVQSNILMGVTSFLFLIKEIKMIKNKSYEIPTFLYVLKLISTTSVTLTFFIVFTYLGPISKDGIPSMLMNSNLFFHLLIPLTSIICFIFFEKTNKLVFKSTMYGLSLTLIYAIYYLVNALIHVENGKVSPIYDWYWFVQNGVWTAIIVVPVIFIITYIISLLLWKTNKTK